MSTPKKIVILGATGNIGTPLVHHLLSQGHNVTAVARPSERLNALAQAGATIAAGDVHDAAFLTEALRGADAAFLMIPPNMAAPDVLGHMQVAGEAIATAVQASGLKQAVHLSSIGANETAGTGPVLGVHYQEIRLNAIEGITVAHLRPAYFMENLLANVSMIKYMGSTGSALRPELQFPMVATRDIATKAAELLNSGKLENHSIHYLLGTRNYSMQDATTIIGQAINRPELKYVQSGYGDEKQGMMRFGLSESMADLYIDMMRHMNEEKVMVHEQRTAESTTPTTLEEFVQTAFAPAFQGAMAA